MTSYTGTICNSFKIDPSAELEVASVQASESITAPLVTADNLAVVEDVDVGGDITCADLDVTNTLAVGLEFSVDSAGACSADTFTQTAVSGGKPENPTTDGQLVTKYYCDRGPRYAEFTLAGTFPTILDRTETVFTVNSTRFNYGNAVTLNAGRITANFTGLYEVSYTLPFVNEGYNGGAFGGLLTYERRARISRNANTSNSSDEYHCAYDLIKFWAEEAATRDYHKGHGVIYAEVGDTIDMMVRCETDTVNQAGVSVKYGDHTSGDLFLRPLIALKYLGTRDY